MRYKAIELVQQKLNKQGTIKDNEMAMHLKKSFDELFFPTWQVVVGKSFGSDIDYEENHVLYFHVNSTAILIWKAG